MTFKYHRGVYARDQITGFAGCVTARSDYITGCNRYCLQPPVGEDGKIPDSQWFDEPCLEVDTSRQQLRLHTPGDPPG